MREWMDANSDFMSMVAGAVLGILLGVCYGAGV
jgi:hypothetical protein